MQHFLEKSPDDVVMPKVKLQVTSKRQWQAIFPSIWDAGMPNKTFQIGIDAFDS